MKIMNLRERYGRGAFPDETPASIKLRNQVMRTFTAADPVPRPPVLGPTVLYLDLSMWNWPMDFSVAYARGIRVVFIKVSQGAWVDVRFHQLVQAALDAGMLVGFYHFIDPTQTSVSPEAAARQAARLTKDVGHLSMWMDAEWNGNLTTSGMLDYLIRWHDAYKTIDERMVEVYTRHSFFTSEVSPSNFWINNKIGLNSARYHLGLTSPWSDNRYVPRDWLVTIPDFLKRHWQFLADGNGLGAYFGSSGAISIDLNLFRGIWSQLEEYYGLNGETEPPPPIDKECIWSFETIKRVRYRTEPSIVSSNTIVGYLNPGDIVAAKTVEVPNGYQVWLEFEKDGQTVYSALVHNGTKYHEPIRRLT